MASNDANSDTSVSRSQNIMGQRKRGKNDAPDDLGRGGPIGTRPTQQSRWYGLDGRRENNQAQGRAGQAVTTTITLQGCWVRRSMGATPKQRGRRLSRP